MKYAPCPLLFRIRRQGNGAWSFDPLWERSTNSEPLSHAGQQENLLRGSEMSSLWERMSALRFRFPSVLRCQPRLFVLLEGTLDNGSGKRTEEREREGEDWGREDGASNRCLSLFVWMDGAIAFLCGRLPWSIVNCPLTRLQLPPHLLTGSSTSGRRAMWEQSDSDWISEHTRFHVLFIAFPLSLCPSSSHFLHGSRFHPCCCFVRRKYFKINPRDWLLFFHFPSSLIPSSHHTFYGSLVIIGCKPSIIGSVSAVNRYHLPLPPLLPLTPSISGGCNTFSLSPPNLTCSSWIGSGFHHSFLTPCRPINVTRVEEEGGGLKWSIRHMRNLEWVLLSTQNDPKWSRFAFAKVSKPSCGRVCYKWHRVVVLSLSAYFGVSFHSVVCWSWKHNKEAVRKLRPRGGLLPFFLSDTANYHTALCSLVCLSLSCRLAAIC